MRRKPAGQSRHKSLPAIFPTSWGEVSTSFYEKMICLSKGVLRSASAFLVVVSFSNFLFLLPTFGVVGPCLSMGPFFGVGNTGLVFASDFLAQPDPAYPKPPFFPVLRKESSGPVSSCFQSTSQVETGSEPQPAVLPGATEGGGQTALQLPFSPPLPMLGGAALDSPHLAVQTPHSLRVPRRLGR